MRTMTVGKCRPIRSRHQKRLRVRLEFMEPRAESVCIAGTFNDWRPQVTPMVAMGGGRWVKELSLPPDDYEYLLVVDGEWIPDPRAEDYMPNPFGGMNSVLRVPSPASVIAKTGLTGIAQRALSGNDTKPNRQETNRLAG